MERWYRQFLLLLSFSTFVFIPLELVLSGHTEGLIQWVPFIASGCGIITLLLWKFYPNQGTVTAVRLVMLSVCATCAWGMYEHFIHNLEFELEIRPGSTVLDVLWPTLSGASPLLAPGILLLAGIMALAAVRKPREHS